MSDADDRQPEPTPEDPLSVGGRVQILDETTSNQIAAGEVVERPAAAVKELVENALDAGASRVLVEVEEGGKYLIRVTDDGCGMNQQDAILALQRHATSKIRTADDLSRITTMGFRGEALPSIASVSQFTLTTRSADDPGAAGVELHCRGGSLDEVLEVGARTGTSILVENLFYNVPARLKFLKTSSTELAHIVDTLQRFALAYPEVAFRLTSSSGNGSGAGANETFSSPGSGSLADAAVAVFGREVVRHLAAIDNLAGSNAGVRTPDRGPAYGTPTAYRGSDRSRGIRVHGYIGTPAALKNSRAWQHTFVNRRFVRSKAVTRAIDEAFKSVQTLHAIKYPPAVVLIEIDPSQVDVNVSPTKTEVRFVHEGEVFSAVYHAVREALLKGGLVVAGTNGQELPHVLGGPRDGGISGTLLDVPPLPAGRTRFDFPGQSPLLEPSNANTGEYPDDQDRGYITTGSAAQARSAFTPPGPYSRHDTDAFDSAVRERAGLVHPPPSGAALAAAPFALSTTSYTYPAEASQLPFTPDRPGSPQADYPGAAHDVTAGYQDDARTQAADYRGARSVRVLAQTRNMYIVAQTNQAILLIDQHIAHERVLYEMLINRAGAASATGIMAQQLIIPLTLEVSRREAMVVEKRLDELRRAGFDLEPFGGDSFLVRAVPASVATRRIKAQGGPEAVLREIIEEMVEKTTSRRLLLPAEEVLITASCKMAVKAGDPLTFEEMHALVDDLMRCENPYTCPHGRPILIEMPNSEVDRKFGR